MKKTAAIREASIPGYIKVAALHAIGQSVVHRRGAPHLQGRLVVGQGQTNGKDTSAPGLTGDAQSSA